MAITISQQYAQIGIQTTSGKWNMESQAPKLLMHQKHAKVNIETELPKVQIDQYECFAEEGLKNMKDLTQERNQMAKQSVMSYIERMGSEGKALGAIQNGGNPISQIAKNSSTITHEFGLGTVPTSRPNITVTGSVRIQAEPNGQGVYNGVEFQVQKGNLNINYNRGSVDIYLRQEAKLDIRYEPDNKINIKI